MGVQYIPVGFCPQYESTWSVQGSRGSYIVQLHADERAAPSCSCPAFTFFKGEQWDRTCKHLQMIWDHGCLFNPQWKDAGPNDYAQHGLSLVEQGFGGGGEPCPGCGQPMIRVVIAV
jgi:hypothetical protein